MYEKYFDVLEHIGVAHECDKTDGRTDFNKCAQTRALKNSA